VPIISIFFILLVSVFAAVVFFTEPSKTDKLIHSRLISLDKRITGSVEDETGIVKEVTFSRIPALDEYLRRNRIALGMQRLIEQADVQWTVGRFMFFTLVSIAIGAALGSWWIGPTLMGLVPGLALGAAPLVFLLQKRKYRLNQFSSQLPDAIDLMSRCMRAGQALTATLEIVANESVPPLSLEFRQAADEQSFGLPFREAMINLGRRVPLPDLQFLVTAVLVQKETGGNLTQVLDKTSAVIRERNRVEGQMRIRTAQGRLTGWVLCAMPLILFFIMNLLNPGYGMILFEDPVGRMWVMFAVVMMVFGMLVIRKIVDIKV
jgi:tight adherence protein B